MYTEIFLRLEPLGLELAAAAARRAGHQVRILDLQVFTHADYFALLAEWRPDAVAFGVNYLANIPEVIDLAKATRRSLPDTLIVVGGHSASFTAAEILEHAAGAIDCVVKGEGEAGLPPVLEAARDDRAGLHALPGVVTRAGEGPPAVFADIDGDLPARDLLPRAEQVLHRRARSRGVHRADARVPLGLLVLQRLDVLRAQLPAPRARDDRRGAGAHSRAGRVHRRRRRLHPGRARLRDRARDRAARHPQALLPRDPRRRADAQPGGVRVLEAARPRVHVPRHRGDRRGGAEGSPQARHDFRATSRRSTTRAPSASPSPSTSSPTPTGTSGGSRSSGSGPPASPRS